MDEASVEREKAEWVFGLTGGELADSPLEATVSYYDASGTHPATLHYWYEGAPGYLGRSDLRGADSWDCLTTLTFGGGYLPHAYPWLVTDAGAYMLLGTFNNSGETECPGHNAPDVPGVLPEQCGDGIECVLCEATCIATLEGYRQAQARGEDGTHGHIYIGEGYEAVYVLLPESQTDREDWQPCAVCHKITHTDNLDSYEDETTGEDRDVCRTCRNETR